MQDFAKWLDTTFQPDPSPQPKVNHLLFLLGLTKPSLAQAVLLHFVRSQRPLCGTTLAVELEIGPWLGRLC